MRCPWLTHQRAAEERGQNAYQVHLLQRLGFRGQAHEGVIEEVWGWSRIDAERRAIETAKTGWGWTGIVVVTKVVPIGFSEAA